MQRYGMYQEKLSIDDMEGHQIKQLKTIADCHTLSSDAFYVLSLLYCDTKTVLALYNKIKAERDHMAVFTNLENMRQGVRSRDQVMRNLPSLLSELQRAGAIKLTSPDYQPQRTAAYFN